MREDSNGRSPMSPWGNTPTRFAVGDKVVPNSGADRGTVVAVSTVVSPLISVVWDSDPEGEIIYPMNTELLRRAMPWEQ